MITAKGLTSEYLYSHAQNRSYKNFNFDLPIWPLMLNNGLTRTVGFQSCSYLFCNLFPSTQNSLMEILYVADSCQTLQLKIHSVVMKTICDYSLANCLSNNTSPCRRRYQDFASRTYWNRVIWSKYLPFLTYEFWMNKCRNLWRRNLKGKNRIVYTDGQNIDVIVFK